MSPDAIEFPTVGAARAYKVIKVERTSASHEISRAIAARSGDRCSCGGAAVALVPTDRFGETVDVPVCADLWSGVDPAGGHNDSSAVAS